MNCDKDLITGIIRRDEAACEALFSRYKAPVRAYLMGFVRDRSAADDLVQELFLRVWERAGQWRGEGDVKGWIFRIGKNLALNHLDAVRRRRQQSLDIPVEPEDQEEDIQVPAWLEDRVTLWPDQAYEQGELRRHLAAAVAELPEEKRQVFTKVYQEHMEIDAVAQELAIPSGTVKSRLHYARRYIAQHWKERERPDE